MPYLWDVRAWSDYQYWVTQDKKTLRKINALLKDIARMPGGSSRALARARS